MLDQNSFERGNAASYLLAERMKKTAGRSGFHMDEGVSQRMGGFALRKGTMKTTRRASKGPGVCKQPEAVAAKMPANRDGFSPRAKFWR